MTRIITTIALAVIIGLVSLGSVADAAPPWHPQPNQPQSGMLLGIYAFPNWKGLRVTGTIPGYAAHGRLRANDVLLRATTDGVTVYPIKSHAQIERAKDAIGPYREAAIEIFRPGAGLIYAWVEFQPVGGAVQYRSTQPGRASQSSSPAQPQSYTAKIRTEAEKPGAAQLFRNQPAGNAGQPIEVGKPVTPSLPPVRTPGSLFNR